MTQSTSLDLKQIEKIVANPSLSAVTYQARALIQELNRLTEDEYPSQTCHIRDVFLCFAEYILGQLLKLYDPQNPMKVKGTGIQRLRAFAEALQEIYSNIRYLWASSPRQSPPGLQVALGQMLQLYFPKGNGKPLCVVRPQWKYNLKYVPLSRQLQQLIAPGVLDPAQENGIKTKEDVIPILWREWWQKLPKGKRKFRHSNPPEQLAILSFAALDTEDALLYPLLGHEIGHFIDHSYAPQLHFQNPLRRKLKLNPGDFFRILEETGDMESVRNIKALQDYLENRAIVCVQELLADLLATRMLGFSFFVSQTEFLKTLYGWPGPKILESGYPGIKFRLSVIFNHLTLSGSPLNVRKFLEEQTKTRPDFVLPLLHFLKSWEKRLAPGKNLSTRKKFGQSKLERQLDEMIETMVEGLIPNIEAMVIKCIPDSICTKLTPRFFDRIAKLQKEIPPSLEQEGTDCFAEIMSSAWAYQILFGEKQEAQKRKVEDRMGEYRKTCRLVLKAVELIPVLQTSQKQPKRAKGVPPPDDDKLGESLGEDRRLLIKGGVLGFPHIKHRLQLPLEDPDHLSVTPLNVEKIQPASLDVHLGNWFVISKRTKLKGIQLGGSPEEDFYLPPREEVFVPFEKTFLIHPGDLVLGATMEFLALPADLMAFMEGRSTLGRQGLLINTAVTIAPGFHGVVVLELANTGSVPIEMTPGMTIAQVMFHGLTEPLPEHQLYRGRYYCQIKP